MIGNRPVWRWIAPLAVLIALTSTAFAQAVKPGPLDPLPQDTGAAGVKQMLRKLNTTGRLLQIDAHPDDEDGGMLTLEARGNGIATMLLTLNRGEGGQNKVGSNLFDVLGVLRTLELTAADRYYGVEQRFTRVADFGFSKSADETFQKWGGHDVALADIVRVIREFHPDVIAARFSGTSRDGHGHHQASALLAQEAYHAAADPKRFPEQIEEGLRPWQTKKLYVGNVCGFGASTCPDENYTVKLNTGQVDPALGMSYIQFAMEGLRHQLSQGAGGWSVEPGDRFTFYKLVDSVVPPQLDKNGHEKDFFDGIDTTVLGLAPQLGAEETKVPWLTDDLKKIADNIGQAAQRSGIDRVGAAEPIYAALDGLRSARKRLMDSDLSPPAKGWLLQMIDLKELQAETAFNLALDVSLSVTVGPTASAGKLVTEKDALTVVSPGQEVNVSVTFHNGSKYPLFMQGVSLEGFGNWFEHHLLRDAVVQPGQALTRNFSIRVPRESRSTRPYWHRDDPERQSVNTIDQKEYATFPFPPAALRVHAGYELLGGARADLSRFGSSLERNGRPYVGTETYAPALVRFLDETGKEQKHLLAVAPVFSVMLEPGEQAIRVENRSATIVKVAVSCNLSGAPSGDLSLAVPSGWRVEPASQAVKLDHRGATKAYEFKVFPASLKEGDAEIRAVLAAGGANYSEGYSLVTREDLGSFYYYQPAIQRVSIVDVKVPEKLKVAYILGAGDDIPTTLTQIGIDTTVLPAEKIASGDLSKYGTIVLGIRAYDTQKDIAANNKKLLDYVSAGGTLVVQYNAGVADFNSGHFTPYPAELSRTRVSVEETPVEILAPDDGIFHYPNEISQRDFDGWVQERGLNFMDQWDDHFKPLLASHDPGEPAQKGGLLRAQYGKGTYLYTGYAFFRQLPAGVPGAIRLFVNLLSAGRESSR